MYSFVKINAKLKHMGINTILVLCCRQNADNVRKKKEPSIFFDKRIRKF